MNFRLQRHAAFAAAVACVFFLAAQMRAAETSTTEAPMAATVIMGLEGVKNNTHGKLAVTSDGLQFTPDAGAAAQVGVASIRDVSVGLEDRQVGGIPMMMGKAAIPYSGGRFISLFSHKKYDSFTVEYVDANGGLHGAIFRIAKGEGLNYRRELASKGAKISPEEQSPTANQEVKNETK